MGQHRHLKLGLASRLILAALALLLPLVVFVLILVQDRNTQIHAAENQIAGLHYLTDLRDLLEHLPRHTAAHLTAAHPADTRPRGVDMTVSVIDRTLARLQGRIAADGDLLGIREPLTEFRTRWDAMDHAEHAVIAADTLDPQGSLEQALIGLFHLAGNLARRDQGGTLKSNQLSQLLAHDIPRLAVQINTARIRASKIAAGGTAPSPEDIRRLTNDDWSITLFHDRLLEEFHGAVAEDPEVAGMLEADFEAFDRDTAVFHAVIVRGEIQVTPDELILLGDDAIQATLRLFDRIVPVLTETLEARLAELERTKRIAIAAVVAASLIAAVCGWLLLQAMTRPLQVEIAERRRVEHRLRGLAAIVEQSNDAILTLSERGIVTSWNSGAERLYGYPAKEIVGNSISCVAPDGYENETASLLRRCLAGEKLMPQETVRRRKDGALIDVSLRFSAVLDETGTQRSIAVITRDISERKKAEAELLEKERMLESRVTQLHNAQDQLRQHRDQLEDLVRERTAEVREKAVQLEFALRKEKEFNALQRKFVSVASHEFRTPLSIIDGAAQRIERHIATIGPDDLAARVTRIRGAVSRMLVLIESTLSASRIDEGHVHLKSQDVDIGQLVEAVCERQGEVAGSPHIGMDLDGLPSAIEGDPDLLDQVITNLVTNAVKYAPDAPEISVIGTTVSADWITVCVQDNGVGIPETELEHLFDRFFRASTSEGIPGTGIGLNLVNEFVTMHGGRIDVESDVGAGSRFTVHLPIRQPAGNVNDIAGGHEIAAA